MYTEAEEAGRPHVQSEGGISRRRIIQGVAWTTPAIVLAVATPPAAASDGAPAGYLTFTTAHVYLKMEKIFDYNWDKDRPILLIDPDLTNTAPGGGATATNVTIQFAVPKSWLPNGQLAWHGAYTYQPGGGTPPFSVSVSEATTSYIFTLISPTSLGPNSSGTFSPEYRIELASSPSPVGQTLTQTARANANGSTWLTAATSTIVAN
ncbi:MAG: hypothetical protein NVV57_03755 [Demequina sp.]|nr:hypothetical protein [Demequina sp.]